jgi:hypothetical protein
MPPLICILTWASWEEADLGFRLRLDAELVAFGNSHQENINKAYKRGSRVYLVQCSHTLIDQVHPLCWVGLSSLWMPT